MQKKLISRLLNPYHLYKIIKLNRDKSRTNRVFKDEQLQFYSKIIPNGFLHYGYFDDSNIDPKEISIGMIYRAQERYAEKLLELVSDSENKILDIGCGMGGLIKMMLAKNLNPVALTPDSVQADTVAESYPSVKLFQCKFEDLPYNNLKEEYGTVITSESLQYLNLDISLPIINHILKTNGKWIACDYFKIGDKAEKSGHKWDVFEEKLAAAGFKLTHKEDITPNILPTLGYLFFMATKLGLPVFDFGISKLKVKKKGYYYGIEPFIDELKEKINKGLQVVNPELFAQNKRYILMVIERI